MVPAINHPRYRQLVTGELTFQFQAYAMSMCVSRNIRMVEKEGKSPTAIKKAIDDVYAFIVKYESVLQADIAAIFG
jgi:hypothetical protein